MEVVNTSLMQLLWQLPMLTLYLIGMIVALANWPKCPVPSLLTLIGTVILFLCALIYPFVTQYIINSFRTDHAQMAPILSVAGLISTLIHLVGFGLILTAVFIGRKDVQHKIEE